jgi:hypothetical protein
MWAMTEKFSEITPDLAGDCNLGDDDEIGNLIAKSAIYSSPRNLTLSGTMLSE